MISISSVQRTAEELMAKAAIEIPQDYLAGLRKCADTEKGDLSAFVIKAMLENYEAAKEDRRAMCGDTGLPRWYVKIGNEAGIEGGKRFYLDTLIGFGKRGLACQPAIVGVGLGGSKDTSMVLGKQASCLRVVGSRNPDPKIAALEEEFKELGNSIGMGAMGFVGSSMVIDCHIEVGYCHTGGMPMSVHMFCLSSRRACARISANGKATFRTDPMWFTDYMRRETVEWGRQTAEAAE